MLVRTASTSPTVTATGNPAAAGSFSRRSIPASAFDPIIATTAPNRVMANAAGPGTASRRATSCSTPMVVLTPTTTVTAVRSRP